MLADTFSVAVVVIAALAVVLLLSCAVVRRPGSQRLVVDRILGNGRLSLLGRDERIEVTTVRDLPVSVGDRVRLARRAGFWGVTLIPVRVRRFGKRRAPAREALPGRPPDGGRASGVRA